MRKVESCSKIKDGNERLAQREDEVRRVGKEYFEDLYNIDTEEQVAFLMCGFDGIRRATWKAEVEIRVGNGKAPGKDEIVC